MCEVKKEDIEKFREDFSSALGYEYKMGYLKFYMIQYSQDSLRIQYAWNSEPDKDLVHNFTAKTGDWFDAKDCLRESHLIHIYGRHWDIYEYENGPGNIICTIGGVADCDCPGDGNNPYAKSLRY